MSRLFKGHRRMCLLHFFLRWLRSCLRWPGSSRRDVRRRFCSASSPVSRSPTKLNRFLSEAPRSEVRRRFGVPKSRLGTHVLRRAWLGRMKKPSFIKRWFLQVCRPGTHRVHAPTNLPTDRTTNRSDDCLTLNQMQIQSESRRRAKKPSGTYIAH